ncbi:DUF3293 domain-containing protein [Thioalkalivibrio sp. ALMg11]|uniref:DUF3293 domain-containing protein n=1 Tax=Thioalkalivibrio sp. ALMg11 TaxID=1158165 RepID=UPI00035FE34E|nr:DUF3293 domain-containing protein [Thioalkalivibrio sp. ALMg11]
MSANSSKNTAGRHAQAPESTPSAAQRAELEQAYRSADYCLETEDGRRVLYIDRPAEDVTVWMAGHGIQRLVVFTASNPGSQRAPRAENERQHRTLEAAVAHRGLQAWPACNRDPSGHWPDEPGLAIADLPDDLLARWLEAFGQNAAVLLEPPAPPRLVWHPGLGK